MSVMTRAQRLLSVGLMALLAGATLSVAVPGVAVADKAPQEWDGLERQKSKKYDNLYIRPGVQFKAYKRVRLDPVEVQMDKDWDPNRYSAGVHRMSSEDILKMRSDLSKLFREVFLEKLGKGGYPVVDKDGDDVLRVQAAMINVYVNAPDMSMQTAGRSRTYTTDAGRMTLVLQMLDSVTGQVLARVVDTRQGTDMGRLTWSNSVTNKAEATRIIGVWADGLVKGLDRVNGRTSD